MSSLPATVQPTTAIASTDAEARLWRYVALNQSRQSQRGEMVAASAADVRASLRRIGLQVIDLRPMKHRHRAVAAAPLLGGMTGDLVQWWHRRCRAQRAAARAEFYDSLATMLASGLPLLEAMQTLVESREEDGHRQRGSGRGAFVQMREQLRGGDSLAQAMRAHPGWFDAIDIAIVEAGQHSGTLPTALGGLAQRQERVSELSHKLLGALAYPALILIVGLGVVMFLSVKTLPDLTKILVDAHIPIPGLTARVMWLGQTLASHWLLIVSSIAVALVLVSIVPRVLSQLPLDAPRWISRALERLRPPQVLRRLLVGGLALQLADLLRSGVPMVEALRVLAPTQRSGRLRRRLTDAAGGLERGDELSAALNDRAWFDPEIRRLLDIGQASGELDDMLTRIGERYQRRAKRLIDRLVMLLEPAVLLCLAALVGTVVITAVLPLLALQEIIR